MSAAASALENTGGGGIPRECESAPSIWNANAASGSDSFAPDPRSIPSMAVSVPAAKAESRLWYALGSTSPSCEWGRPLAKFPM
jgi:hypothetical protein